MDFIVALFQYLKTMKNCIHDSSFVIMSNIFCIILFLVHESLQLINETSSSKPSEQGVMKGSCKEEKLEKWYHHFNNLLGRAPVLEDEYRDNDLSKICP